MHSLKHKDKRQKTKPNFFQLMTEVFAWLQIAASPFLIGLAIGVIIYILKSDKTGLIIAISIAALGLITGIIWATKIWKKKGTVDFISRSMASPDFDNLPDEKE